MGFGDARKTFEKVRIQSPLQALRQTAGFPRTFSTHIKLCRAGQALQSAPPPPGSLPPGHPGPAAEPRAGRRAACLIRVWGYWTLTNQFATYLPRAVVAFCGCACGSAYSRFTWLVRMQWRLFAEPPGTYPTRFPA